MTKGWDTLINWQKVTTIIGKHIGPDCSTHAKALKTTTEAPKKEHEETPKEDQKTGN